MSGSAPDAIRADIERARENLAETVDALHAKLDVSGQAKAKVAQVKDQQPPRTASHAPRSWPVPSLLRCSSPD